MWKMIQKKENKDLTTWFIKKAKYDFEKVWRWKIKNFFLQAFESDFQNLRPGFWKLKSDRVAIRILSW